jgi:hypothetical protein
VLAFPAFAVDSCKEAIYRRPLSSSDLPERIPKSIFHGHTGLAPVEPDGSFENPGFSVWDFGWRHPQILIAARPSFRVYTSPALAHLRDQNIVLLLTLDPK